MPGGGLDTRFEELYAAARAARTRADDTCVRTEFILKASISALQLHQLALARATQHCGLRLSGQPARLQYSAYARLQARLASMPVIEQAKGVLMAQFGWTADEAFDVLRKASQRSGIRVRDLAERIVAATARAAQDRPEISGARGRRDATTLRALIACRSEQASAG